MSPGEDPGREPGAEDRGTAGRDEEPAFRVVLIREGREEGLPAAPRTLRFPLRRLRRSAWAGAALVVLLLLSWGYLALRSVEAGRLAEEVRRLEGELVRVEALASTLAEVEAAYERIRALYGPEALPQGSEWLPPAAGRGAAGSLAAEQDGSLPTTWPLTRPGFLTQPLVEGAGDDHPGIDIAVPAGSYVRAAGPGRVAVAADDPVYGRYLVLEHEEGYRTLYGHTERLLVEQGDEVRRGEVIALSGSSGRSTAPHLHFEILHGDEAIDPMTLVQQP